MTHEGSDVSIQIFAPNGNLATVAQVTPSLDGNFSTMINTASLKSDGTYMIKAQYGKLAECNCINRTDKCYRNI